MAQVGDVLVTARADVGQAKQAFAGLNTALRASLNAMRDATSSAAISLESLRHQASDLATVELPRGSSALAQYGARLAGSSGLVPSTRSLNSLLPQTSKGLGLVRTAFLGVASSAVGVSGPLRGITSGLLLFGAGSTLSVGIAAGLAGIALGIRKLRERAVEAKQALTELITKGRELFQQGTEEQRRKQIEELTRAQLALTAAQGEFAEAGDKFVNALRAQAQGVPITHSLIQRLGEESVKAFTRMELLSDAVRGFQGAMAGELPAIEVRAGGNFAALTNDLTEAVNREFEAFVKARDAISEQASAVRDALDPTREFVREMERLRMLEREGALTRSERFAREEQILASTLPNLKDIVAPPWVKAKMKQDFDDLGLTAAGAFTRGFIRSAFEGFKGFGSVLKNVFASLFEDALIQALRRLGRSGGGGGGFLGFLGGLIGLAPIPGAGAIGGALTPGGGTGPRGSPMGPPDFLVVNVGPPRSPTDMARDATWQAALRASLLEAETGGFRLARR